jgi:glucose-1-phosphate cytidylyltransferase
VKAVILAGGVGTRLSEETGVRPKPMVEIGGKPIVWHIMKIYAAHGITDFVIAAGYKSHIIKEYFASYFLRLADVTIDLGTNELTAHVSRADPWRVTIVETGDATMTGGRLKRVAQYLDGETFCLTYGDCVSDVDISELVRFHEERGAVCTVTAVQPPGRFGVLGLTEGVRISGFFEKPEGEGPWINGGFFVLEPGALDVIEGDESIWEREPLQQLTAEGHVAAYRHSGFWQPMDTLREQMILEELWESGSPPWKTW